MLSRFNKTISFFLLLNSYLLVFPNKDFQFVQNLTPHPVVREAEDRACSPTAHTATGIY